VRYLVVGMSAALMQGVRGSTEDVDLWFASLADERIAEAARSAGGFLVTRPNLHFWEAPSASGSISSRTCLGFRAMIG
jgi:hypothetical protein